MTGETSTLYLRFLRAYAWYLSLLLLAFSVGWFVVADRVYEAPIRFRSFNSDGSGIIRTESGPLRVETVVIGDSKPLPPGDIRAIRSMMSAPEGTSVRWVENRDGTLSTHEGEITSRPITLRELIGSSSRLVIALSFLLGGIILARAAADLRGFLAAAAMAGTAWTFPPWGLNSLLRLFEGTPLATALRILDALALWALGLYFFHQFLVRFPTRLRTRWARWSGYAVLVTSVAAAVSTSLYGLPGVMPLLPLTLQTQIHPIPASMGTIAYLIFAAAVVPVVIQQMRNVPRIALPAYDRKLARRAGLICVASLVCPLSIIFVQAAWLLSTGSLLLPGPFVAASLLALVAIPPTVVWAMLSRRRSSVGVLAKRALLFSATENSIRTAALLPMAAALLILWKERDKALGSVLGDHPILFTIAAVIAFVGIRGGGVIMTKLQSLFGRRRPDTSELMHTLGESFRRCSNDSEIRQAAVAQINYLVPVEEAAIFVETDGDRYHSDSAETPELRSDGVMGMLERTHQPIDVIALLRQSSDAIPDDERSWLSEHEIAYLFPMLSGSGQVMGALAVAEKRSELPFDDRERSLLASVADATAIAIENQILRTPGTFSRVTPLQDAPGEAMATTDASVCSACGLVMPPGAEGRCPEDRGLLMPLPMPRLVAGKYRLERRVGEGGMGVVYQARDLSLGRLVAIKALPRLSSEAAARLRREARATAGIAHAAIATIYAVETWRGQPIIVLEYVAGGTWDRMIDDQPRPVTEVLRTGIGVASALNAAHQIGILHRDIKPSNIGFTSSGDVRVLDFGLAKFLDPAQVTIGSRRDQFTDAGDDLSLTRSDTVVGTPAYIAPEAALGAPPAPSFDLWSLAITLYEALTSTNPIAAATSEGTLNRILEANIPDVREYRPAVSDGLAEFLANALSRDIMRRPQSAAAFARELGRVGADG